MASMKENDKYGTIHAPRAVLERLTKVIEEYKKTKGLTKIHPWMALEILINEHEAKQMSATREGGLKAAVTNKARHGEDFYKRAGSKGGKAGGPMKGFALNTNLAKEAGKKGGASRKGKKKAKRQKLNDSLDDVGDKKQTRYLYNTNYILTNRWAYYIVKGMNNELQIKIDGKKANALMFKYKVGSIATTLTNTISHKLMDDFMPKVDQFFVNH